MHNRQEALKWLLCASESVSRPNYGQSDVKWELCTTVGFRVVHFKV